MKTIFISILLLISVSTEALSQDKAIRIFDSETNEEIVIREKKRIRVKTNERKITGRFRVISKDSIVIRKMKIALQDIIKIKRSPFFHVMLNAVILHVPAALGLIGSAILAWGANSTVEALSAASALGVTFGYVFGAISINVLKGYRPGEKMTISIINY